MKRRTLVRKLGAAGIATTTVGGAAAARRPGGTALDRELDVSSVSGRTTLAELLDPSDRRRLPADVEPAEFEVVVAPAADSITIAGCCEYCCDGRDLVCEDHCDCCTCSTDSCL